jgi:TolB-like protein
MENAAPCFSLNLLGPFRLLGPGGERIEIPSKKGAALIAMLATAREGEHTRGWLQDKLWGTREATQARASLRRELSSLRSRLNRGTWELLICEREVVRLNLDLVAVDIRSLDLVESIPGGPRDLAPGEFFEGQDIAGEDGFEEWLREQRSALGRHNQRGDARLTDANKVRSATTLAIPVVDVSQPPAGFNDSSALAVLRFKNLSGDPVNDYIAEGASEDLIDRLSRIRWLPVIARSSSFSFPEDTDPNEIGRRLGARYVLHGRLRYGAESLWISADLADSTNGYTI